MGSNHAMVDAMVEAYAMVDTDATIESELRLITRNNPYRLTTTLEACMYGYVPTLYARVFGRRRL